MQLSRRDALRRGVQGLKIRIAIVKRHRTLPASQGEAVRFPWPPQPASIPAGSHSAANRKSVRGVGVGHSPPPETRPRPSTRPCRCRTALSEPHKVPQFGANALRRVTAEKYETQAMSGRRRPKRSASPPKIRAPTGLMAKAMEVLQTISLLSTWKLAATTRNGLGLFKRLNIVLRYNEITPCRRVCHVTSESFSLGFAGRRPKNDKPEDRLEKPTKQDLRVFWEFLVRIRKSGWIVRQRGVWVAVWQDHRRKSISNSLRGIRAGAQS
jgi:hypothetical protein